MRFYQFYRIHCFIIFFSCSIHFSCKKGKEPISGFTVHQQKQNAFFQDASKSPLTKKQLKSFKALPFFKLDSSFMVKAYLEKQKDENFKDIPTSTERIAKQRVYGLAKMKIKGETITLNIYQTESAFLNKLDNTLFLPFLDLTNGENTYAGGRYLDLIIPDNDSLIIDFNRAYNPYCAYNPKYSCPIVPSTNFIHVKVEAGVMYLKEN